MPILKREPEFFPDDLFGFSPVDFPWWVAHVRSRQEKALARHLAPREVPFYLPQHEHRARRNGRFFTSHIPLFPGYVFFRGPRQARAAVFDSSLVVRIIEVTDQDLLARELSTLRALQESGALLVPHPWVSLGDVVRISSGLFEGYPGIVIRERGRTRLVISVTMLQRSVAVELERDSVTPVPRSRPSEGAIRAIA
jgi:transcription antitermination factor NusG